jgi:hypothetical protein
MTPDKFDELVRSGNATVHVDKVRLRADGQVVKGKGLLRISQRALQLDLEITAKSVMPIDRKTQWFKNDFWKLTGVIDGDLKFWCDGVSPACRTDSWRVGKKRTVQTLDFHAINLASEGWDKLTNAQKHKALGSTEKRTSKHPHVEFKAVLVACDPVFLNAGTETRIRNDFLGPEGTSAVDTFIDRDKDYDFALIRKGEDLSVHFRSKGQFCSKSEGDDRHRFQSLLFAIGFTHGFQPWPYRREYWRAGRKISETFTAPHELTKTPHAPFDKGIGRGVGLGRKGTCNSPIRIVAKFFERRSTLSEEIAYLLFLFREAGGSSVNLHIETLALCSLFEGVVDLLFNELKLEHQMRINDSHFDEYLKLRDRLATRLTKIARSGNRAFERLAGSLSHAEAFRVKHKFKALCEHFGLKFNEEMKRHLEAWEAQRNPLMHGNLKARDADFVHQSRIAGAINILLLKLMGYSGPVRAVLFSDEPSEIHRTI